MSKVKKEAQPAELKSVPATEVPDTGLLNPSKVVPPAVDPEIFIDEVDFNELLELEKAARTTEEQLNKLAGTIFRLKQDQGVYHEHEKKLNSQIDVKRKELVRRYKIDEQRRWQIDINSKKVVYSQ